MSFLGDLIGGIFGNKAADKAADTQVDQMRLAIDEQRAARTQAERLGAPAIAMGNSARDLYGASFGLSPTSGQTTVGQQPQTQPRTQQSYGGDFGRSGLAGNALAQYATMGSGESSGFGYNQGGGAFNALQNIPGMLSGQTVEAPAQQTPEELQQMAYDRFLSGGYNQAATDFTNNDLSQIKGAMGAGGKALSGSAVGAMGDRLARNRYGAYVDNQNALAGLAGAATAGSSALASQGQASANNISGLQQNIGNARASSYLTQGQNNANTVNSGVNAIAQFFGGM